MKKYIITASCNPYHARCHYNGQLVLKYDMATPVKWVADDFYGQGLSLDEAMDILDGYANQLNDDTHYENDESVQSWAAELLETDGVVLDTTWFKGAGWYENNVLVYKRGDMGLEDDVMYYAIEEMDDYANEYAEEE